jgi:uncharacterized FlaG/YvyC family protein
MPVSRNRKTQKQKSRRRTQKIDQANKAYEKLMRDAMEKQVEELRKEYQKENSGVTFADGDPNNNI